MRQLSTVDTQFLAMETDTTFGHVGGLALLDPSTGPGGEMTRSRLEDVLRSRLHLVPPLTQKLRKVPFDLDRPYWVQDPHFDLGFHVREIALPAPGTDEQLAEQIARIHSRRLDRRRPLWEAYLISGLESGNVALYTKVHHASVDGVSGADIMSILYDTDPDAWRTESPAAPVGEGADDGPGPHDVELAVRGLLRLPVNALQTLRVVPQLRPLLSRPPGRAPHTPFNGAITPHRRFAIGTVPLGDAKAIKNHFGTTVNDVIVTLAAGALRRWLIDHNELPEQPLVAMIPVSIRTKEEHGTFGNKVSALLVEIPTHLGDPVERLQFAHERLADAKKRHNAMPANALQDVTSFIPPALHARATRLALSLSASKAVRPLVNLVISNVPGPQVPIYLAGYRQVGAFPVSVAADGMGLNMTFLSYLDRLDIGLTADREQIPDLQRIVEGIESELDVLARAAKPKARKARARAKA